MTAVGFKQSKIQKQKIIYSSVKHTKERLDMNVGLFIKFSLKRCSVKENYVSASL